MTATATNKKVEAHINFTIQGTHNGLEKNPVPKLKMTGKQHWMPKAQEYVRWKSHVVASLIDNLNLQKRVGLPKWFSVVGKPIQLDRHQEAHMELKIQWANEAHGDPENIFGSIADALFQNDKHLSGEFAFDHSPDKKSKVEVIITIYELGKT